MIDFKESMMLFALCLIISTFIVLSNEDFKQAQDDEQFRCDMGALWLDGAFRNVPPEQRDGYPMTLEEYERVCK